MPDWKKNKCTYFFTKEFSAKFWVFRYCPRVYCLLFRKRSTKTQFHPRRIYLYLKYDVFFIHFCAADSQLFEGTQCYYLPGPKKHYRENMDTEYQNQFRANDFELLSNNTWSDMSIGLCTDRRMVFVVKALEKCSLTDYSHIQNHCTIQD